MAGIVNFKKCFNYSIMFINVIVLELLTHLVFRLYNVFRDLTLRFIYCYSTFKMYEKKMKKASSNRNIPREFNFNYFLEISRGKSELYIFWSHLWDIFIIFFCMIKYTVEFLFNKFTNCLCYTMKNFWKLTSKNTNVQYIEQ